MGVIGIDGLDEGQVSMQSLEGVDFKVNLQQQ